MNDKKIEKSFSGFAMDGYRPLNKLNTNNPPPIGSAISFPLGCDSKPNQHVAFNNPVKPKK